MLPVLVADVDAELTRTGVPYALVASAGQHLDVLPAAMDKGGGRAARGAEAGLSRWTT